MGCGSSSVPDVILPDPVPGQKCKVLFKKQGTFAKDQYVYMDGDTDKKWLFMDKEGAFWSNPTYVLENFVREEGSKKGEVLSVAKLEITEAITYGRKESVDSDSSSDDSTDDEGEEMRVVAKMKWAQKIKVKFYSDRERTKKIAEVKVKAKGKAKKETTYTTREVEDKDGEGNVTGTHEETSESSKISKKVKKVKYVIEELEGEDEMPKINLKGKPNKSAYKLEWDGPVFQAEIESSNWGSTEIEVNTDFKNPALGMLMGYIIAKDISPDDIMDKVSVF